MPAKLSIGTLSGEYLAALIAAAQADNHRPIAPTHVALRDGRTVGCFSAFLPTVFFWSDSRNTARETLTLIQAAETAAGRFFTVPCDPASPIYPLLFHRRGYERLGNADLFLVAKP